MKRRKVVQEPENYDRWLVSYADFITLLFGFFVVMYSISSVNEDKTQELSASLSSAFAPGAITVMEGTKTQEYIPFNQEINFIPSIMPLSSAKRIQVMPESNSGEGPESIEGQSQQISEIVVDIEGTLDTLLNSGEATVRQSPFWAEVVFNSSLLFESGSAILAPTGIAELEKLGQTIVELPNKVIIEGFTDNRPINSPIYPSNWELSSARAAAVVRLYESMGINSERLSTVGNGENRAVSDNDTDDGRARNRRVVVVIMAEFSEDNATSENAINGFELLRQGLN